VRYNPWEKFCDFQQEEGNEALFFAENQQLLASSRTFDFLDTKGKIYEI
jgi:hypothetical protein